MRSFLEVSGLWSKSLFAVIEGTRLWPQIRKEILILPNLWTILHKMMEFLVCWQRRNLHSSEDIWVISGRSGMVSPFWEPLFGPHSPFNLLLQEDTKGKPQTHLHELLLWPSNSPTRGRESTLCLSSRGKGTAALWALTPPFQATWSLFPPPKLESSGGIMKPWIKCPRNLLRPRAIPDHILQRDFYQVAAASIFLVDISRRAPRDLMKHIRKHKPKSPSCTCQRGGSGSSWD